MPLLLPKLKEFNPAPKSIMTNVQRMQKVMQVLQDEVRPRLAADGGDIELVDVDGHRVVVALRGLCSNCSSRTVTLKDLVEKILREQVEPEIVVEEVKA